MQSKSGYLAQLRGTLGADLREFLKGFALRPLGEIMWWTMILACLAAIVFTSSATPAFVLIGSVIIRYILTRGLF